MKICQTYHIEFQGRLQGVQAPPEQMFWIIDDQDQRSQVSIPDVAQLIHAFRWMSDHDCLRHLQNLRPTFTTNLDEILEVERFNASVEEHAYLTGTVSKHVDPLTLSTRIHIPGLRQPPHPSWKATWTFWSKEYAVMAKLALGGQDS